MQYSLDRTQDEDLYRNNKYVTLVCRKTDKKRCRKCEYLFNDLIITIQLKYNFFSNN